MPNYVVISRQMFIGSLITFVGICNTNVSPYQYNIVWNMHINEPTIYSYIQLIVIYNRGVIGDSSSS